ncbi:Hypothetical protein ING2D1G_1286 [Peptoniphilus sp. ING2-D1G]|nr:Hypothetical protein ING2D1G_1286 [Peptoniphilus sp. ING2-D1G]
MKKNNKKFLSIVLSMVMVFSLFAPLAGIVDAAEVKANANEIYLTVEGKIDVEMTFDKEVKAENLQWTLGGKDLSQWKSFNQDTTKFEGEPWIKIENLKVEGNKVTATVVNGLPFGVKAVDKRPYPRWAFMDLIGDFKLEAKESSTGEVASIPVKINAYEGFFTYDEIKPELDKIAGEAKEGRYVQYHSNGKTVEGRELHAMVIAKDKASIDRYLNETKVRAMEDPAQLINEVKSGTYGDYKVPIMLSTPHPDEHPGIDSQMRAIKAFATQDSITFKTDEGDPEKVAELNVEQVLDNFILVFNLTENPDGRYHNLRHNANGFDLNRDNIYQIQPETIQITEQIAKWHPVMFLDLHGFVKDFLIEPCTPPHEPNFEYDLLMGGEKGAYTKDTVYGVGAIENAKHMGDIAIANTSYSSYIIPMFDYGDGWDDAFLGYTGVFALIHGALGHTIEIPESNLDSVLAHEHTIIGGIDYALKHKDQVFLNQLEIFNRGIKNEDNRSVDTWHIDPNGNQIGRPRGTNQNFFPEYYILPLDRELQKNPLEVYKMVNYFLRNGVEVHQSTQDVVFDGVTYPKGSIVVPMRQALRGYANMTLYDGVDQSAWGAMYAEVVLDFPAMRGFDKVEVREEGLFDSKTSKITSPVSIPGTLVNVSTENAVVRNDNVDAIKFVNELLKNGKEVSQVTKASGDVKVGDYVVKTTDLSAIASKYYLNAMEDKGNLESKAMVLPKVYLTPSGSNYASTTDATRYVLKNLGFELVDNLSAANTIVDSSGQIKSSEITGKNYIAVGGKPLRALEANKIYPLTTYMAEDGDANEGLLKANYAQDSTISGSYDATDYGYIASGTVITSLPSTAKVISKVSDSSDFYKAGWWPNHDVIKGKAVAAVDKIEDSNVVLFAQDLTNKAHTSHLFRLLANSIYAVNNDTFYDTAGVKTEMSDVSGHWAEAAIRELISKNLINGYLDGTFKPDHNITRAEFIKILDGAFSLDSDKESSFEDIKGHWAKEYIDDAAGLGIINGYSEAVFAPDNNITREEMAKIMSGVLKLEEKGELSFTDKEKIADWATEFVQKAVKAEIIKGYEDNTFRPGNNATRAEAATMILRSMEK